FGDPIRNGHIRFEPEHLADLVEAHLVVAGILVPAHVLDFPSIRELANFLDDVELPIILSRPADVEYLAGDVLAGSVEHGLDSPSRVDDVDVGAPELFPEYLELVIGPQLARELIDREIEPHSRGYPVNGRKSQACRLEVTVIVVQQPLLDLDLVACV